MAQLRLSYYFELPGEDAVEPRNAMLGMTGSFINRPGLKPVDVFASGAELVRALSDERRASGFYAGSGFRQTEIAEEMSVKPAALSRLETEAYKDPAREPTLAKLKAYAAAMGYDVWLVCVPQV